MIIQFKKYLFLVAVLLIAQFSYSQSDSLLSKNQLKFSPLRIVDLVNPGVEISYERLLSKRTSTQLSAAYMTEVFNITPFFNTHGYRLAIEQKYFLHQHATSHRRYFAADLVYYHVNFDKYAHGIKINPPDNSIPYDDTFHINKHTITFNLKCGEQSYIGKHLVFDVCVGLGVRYYHAALSNPNNANIIYDDDKSPFPDIYRLASDANHYVTIIIPLNIKFGYRF